MWHQLAIAVCLMLVLEGIIPFLYPARWRQMVTALAGIDDSVLRMTGFGSMLAGLVLLWLLN